jgi:hypothetical protein
VSHVVVFVFGLAEVERNRFFFSYLVPKKATIIYFAPDFKRRIEMDNSESGDDLGNNFLTVESQSYMVQGEDLDGKVMFSTVGNLYVNA